MPPKPKESPRADKTKPPPTSADFPWEERPRTPMASPPRTDKPKSPTSADFPWDEAPKPKVKPVPPKAKTWSPDFAPPTVPPADAYQDEYAERQNNGYDDTSAHEQVETVTAVAVTRPPRKRNRLAILMGLIAFVVGGLGTGGFFLFKYVNERPDRLFAAAMKEYEEGHFDPARKLFQQFLGEYPENEKAPERASFPSYPICARRRRR